MEVEEVEEELEEEEVEKEVEEEEVEEEILEEEVEEEILEEEVEEEILEDERKVKNNGEVNERDTGTDSTQMMLVLVLPRMLPVPLAPASSGGEGRSGAGRHGRVGRQVYVCVHRHAAPD
ncbi:hypothetical protein Pmani_006130 [Petrolisthes manimaculis]|uniref:Uncharacterized protein n=1 Tax=Petrolisthes manimaculis TaxID=1843537 RepID=A0AAE1QDB6_9EUCA|nr:hypothetical protein Pmani_006130 [Petrolisthes manimaculis]